MNMCNFNYSVSVKPYDRNSGRISSISFLPKYGDLSLLESDLMNGYAVTTACKFNGVFHISEKKRENFKETQLLFFDMDERMLDIAMFNNIMCTTEIQPNLIYTTANDGVVKEKQKTENTGRYRAIYTIDRPITSDLVYTALHDAISNEIDAYTQDRNGNNDHNDRYVEHFFAGNPNACVCRYDYDYSLDWLLDRYGIDENVGVPKTDKRVKHNNNIRSTGIINTFDPFWEDFDRLPLYVLVPRYIGLFHLDSSTPVQFEKDERYKIVDGYTEIHYQWKTAFINGRERRVIDKPKDGEQRRYKLGLNLMLRKAIKPDITLEELTYAALYEVYYHIDNTKDPITKEDCLKRAKYAFTTDVSGFQSQDGKIKINKQYVIDHGLKMKSECMKIVNEVRRMKNEERDAKILQLYDKSLTQDENLILLMENDIVISKKTLKRVLNKNGIRKNKKIKK